MLDAHAPSLSRLVVDIDQSTQLSDATLYELEYRRVSSATAFSGYGLEDGKDLFSLKQSEQTASAGPQFHLAFGAPSRVAVDKFYEFALVNGPWVIVREEYASLMDLIIMLRLLLTSMVTVSRP